MALWKGKGSLNKDLEFRSWPGIVEGKGSLNKELVLDHGTVEGNSFFSSNAFMLSPGRYTRSTAAKRWIVNYHARPSIRR